MNNDDKLLQNYHVNQRTMDASDGNGSAKANAWRKQLLVIENLTSTADASVQYDLMKHHMEKYQSKASAEFIKERVQAVEKLLEGFHPSTNANDSDYDSFQIDELDDYFEPKCHSAFESCRNDEITSEHLAMLKEDTQTTIDNKKGKFNAEQQAPSNATSDNKFSKFLLGNGAGNENIQEAPKRNAIALNQKPNQTATSSAAVEPNANPLSEFRTAREELMLQNLKKYGTASGGNNTSNQATPLFNYGQTKKSLGARRTVRSGFVPPIRAEDKAQAAAGIPNAAITPSPPLQCSPPIGPSPPLANIDPKMVELITNEIMHKYKPVNWNDIAGLEYAKSIIKEAVVYPLLRPDIFTGLRRPPRGILLFGPPGTGKTLIGKCIASQSKSTFFSISASSLTSKWIGDGEKMVRALFAVAAVHQPSVVFIDEIDSLLSQRSESEHESSRRLKNEFLVQLDGAATSDEDRILIVGATNRPQELDEAARRRLVRRLYIPLPEYEARVQILKNLLQTVRNSLSVEEIKQIGEKTEGYSGADMDSLCREASMEPIRSIPADQMAHFQEDNVRPVNMADFETAIQNVRPSVSPEDLRQYLEWNRVYGAKR